MWQLLHCHVGLLDVMPLLCTRVLEEEPERDAAMDRGDGVARLEKGRFVALELATMLGGFSEWVGPPRMLLILDRALEPANIVQDPIKISPKITSQ